MTKDIEREAFEKALAGNKIQNLHICTIFDEEKNEYFASDTCDPSEDHIVESINLSLRMWQAAKAHEAKKLEGCVVVPVESCKWTQDEDSNWWTQCGEGFVFNEDSYPHKHNFKNCCFCGGLLEAARGGNENI